MLLELARNLITWTAEKLHNGCLLFAPHTPYQDLYQSFVCGASLGDPSLSRLYTELGIIHIVVVSGAHLIFLDSLLRLFKREDSGWTLPILFFYALTTRFEAPVVRSLIQILLRRFHKRFQLHWSLPFETMAAGLVTLFLLGPSLSLQLSWVASLGLSPRRSLWVTQLRVYTFLLPLLATLQIAHPISILVNLVLVPALSVAAFPASLLCFFLPQLSKAVDLMWAAAHQIFFWIGKELPLNSLPLTTDRGGWMWVYVAALQMVCLIWFTLSRRNSQ